MGASFLIGPNFLIFTIMALLPASSTYASVVGTLSLLSSIGVAIVTMEATSSPMHVPTCVMPESMGVTPSPMGVFPASVGVMPTPMTIFSPWSSPTLPSPSPPDQPQPTTSTSLPHTPSSSSHSASNTQYSSPPFLLDNYSSAPFSIAFVCSEPLEARFKTIDELYQDSTHSTFYGHCSHSQA